jgi:hypothetical protein
MTSKLARRGISSFAAFGIAVAIVGGAAAEEATLPCASDAPWIEIAASVSPGDGIGGTGRGGFDEGVGGTGRGEFDEGVGGTGRGGFDEGVGGTGRGTPREGVGGTGRSGGVGGTGIYGTITGFGSICVNGERVHYEDDVPVERGNAAAATSDLAVGHRVWVVAREAEGELHAESIVIVPAAGGQVGELDETAGRFEVDGRWVWLTNETSLVTASGEPAEQGELEGAQVMVFGLVDPAGDLVATRVELLVEGDTAAATPLLLEDQLAARDDLTTVSVEGLVLAREAGRVLVGPLWVAVPEGGPVLESGERVWLRGTLTRERLIRPERIQMRPARPLRTQPPVVQRVERSAPKLAAVRPKATKTRLARPEGLTASAARPERPESADGVDRPERPEDQRAAIPATPDRIDRPERADLRPARDAHKVSAARRARAARRAARSARRAAKRAARKAN